MTQTPGSQVQPLKSQGPIPKQSDGKESLEATGLPAPVSAQAKSRVGGKDHSRHQSTDLLRQYRNQANDIYTFQKEDN